jgi:tetratricopeptide (TPR) repeat protein
MQAAFLPAAASGGDEAAAAWFKAKAYERRIARTAFIKALFYKKRHPDAHFGLAEVELMEGRRGRALQHFGLALSYAADDWADASLHAHALQRVRSLGDFHRSEVLRDWTLL